MKTKELSSSDVRIVADTACLIYEVYGDLQLPVDKLAVIVDCLVEYAKYPSVRENRSSSAKKLERLVKRALKRSSTKLVARNREVSC